MYDANLRLTVCVIVAWVIATIATLALSKLRIIAIDEPNERSLHRNPLPRTGGIAIQAGILGGSAAYGSYHWLELIAIGVAAISFLDDRKHVAIWIRLLCQFIAAAAFVFLAARSSNLVYVMALLIAIVWVANLYNFMDGGDGLAGGMAVIGFGAYGFMALEHGAMNLSHLSFCTSAAAFGFLIFNLPPAKIFMGDVGSVSLGFLAGTIGALGWLEKIWPLWFPVVVFAPFVIDASITLLRRALARKRFWEPHREHYYQRLILTGWSHRQTAGAEYGLMIICAACAVIAMRVGPSVQLGMLLFLASLFLVLMMLVDRRWERRTGKAA